MPVECGFERAIVGALASMVRLGQSAAANSKAALGAALSALDERFYWLQGLAATFAEQR